MVTLDLLAIPEGADSVRDWIVWGAAIVGGLVAIGVGIYKIGTWARAAAAAGVFDLMEPKFDEINQKMDVQDAKMDTLAERNDAQHAQVAGQISELSAALSEHNKVLTDHLDESATAAEKLATIVQTVETHIGKLRDEITSPGLPVTPGPPVGGPKHLY